MVYGGDAENIGYVPYRAVASVETTSSGRRIPCAADLGGSMPDTCSTGVWPGSNVGAFYSPKTMVDQQAWMGSLTSGKTDASGFRYMRNRYYNPQTGTFTQPDPMGVAGGLNVYGYVGGNPATYSDPFGLCKPYPQCIPEEWAALFHEGVDAVRRALPKPKPMTQQERDHVMAVTMIATGSAMMEGGDGGESGDEEAAEEGEYGLMLAESAIAAETAESVLMPGGSPVGTAGSQESIREVSGGVQEAQAMFAKLSQGGTPAGGNYPGVRVNLPGGGTVGLRTVMSRSPNSAANIDVNIPGIPITKIKFNP